MNQPLADLGWALTRFVFGMSLALLHGYDKVFNGKVYSLAGTVAHLGFPFPLFFAWCASAAEFFGGLFVAFGFLTRPAAAFVSFTMLVALFQHRHDPMGKMELALHYLALMVLAMLIGGGKYALDRSLKLRSPFVRKTTLDA
ncbi:MAG: DoxX family protein [Myxococcaceae bacterium]|nr:DoxX family protein [Myxococcaceae bacterium]